MRICGRLGKRSLSSFLMGIFIAGQLAQAAGQEQAAKKFALTIDNIMRGPELVGYEPRAVRWSGDSRRIYFQWKQASDPRDKDFDIYVVNRDGSGLKKLTEEEAENAPLVRRRRL
ncbi:MAG TPA: hypothetical protein VNO70_23495 [Blastocatellia bacterium]|nr:hypothetical protein [Blastocatellia bacterium]